MIKSKLNILGIWGGIGFVFIFFFIQSISGFYQQYSGKPLLLDMDARHSLVFNTYVMLMFSLLYGGIFIKSAKIICVNSNDNSISIKNIITRETKIFSYNFLDGYVDGIQYFGIGLSSNAIYLVKGRKCIAKITSFSCSNYDEIKSGLSGLKYLGNKKFTIIDNWKVLFGLPVNYNTP